MCYSSGSTVVTELASLMMSARLKDSSIMLAEEWARQNDVVSLEQVIPHFEELCAELKLSVREVLRFRSAVAEHICAVPQPQGMNCFEQEAASQRDMQTRGPSADLLLRAAKRKSSKGARQGSKSLQFSILPTLAEEEEMTFRDSDPRVNDTSLNSIAMSEPSPRRRSFESVSPEERASRRYRFDFSWRAGSSPAEPQTEEQQSSLPVPFRQRRSQSQPCSARAPRAPRAPAPDKPSPSNARYLRRLRIFNGA
eukprot:TRINITY_DN20827_c0_g2_i1.p1 TRINITY_DN20827_c0_g2~~TRINITY_DN20827_c0_g2_i1.p1  ORF type:complete len:284 (+),score=26.18 TRINITY_DN20827_c0_g2_i1:96-854(+)